MDILTILQESMDDLLPEDLVFFETELATGETYDAEYQAICRNKINQIRKWMSGDINSLDNEDGDNCCKDKKSNKDNKRLIMGIADMIPEGAGPVIPQYTPAQRVHSDVDSIRARSDYKSTFKKYIKESSIVNAEFLDKNFSIFNNWEMNAIVSIKQLGEEFLEKYFGALEHDKIARYQLFSESFFMKHFTQLDTNIVLEKGKNEWRKKENRTKQLDVFLRLKGVKI